jgi:hypothetical protein
VLLQDQKTFGRLPTTFFPNSSGAYRSFPHKQGSLSCCIARRYASENPLKATRVSPIPAARPQIIDVRFPLSLLAVPSAIYLTISNTSIGEEMAGEIPKDPKDLNQEDKDALDALASEEKEFEKASSAALVSEVKVVTFCRGHD